MSLYLEGNTTAVEGYDCSGYQGYILNAIMGDQTQYANVPYQRGDILLQWWTDKTQTLLVAQDHYELNGFRLSIIQGTVLAPYLTIKSLMQNNVSVWTRMHLTGYQIPSDFYDVQTPYGNTWGGQTPPPEVYATFPQQDNYLQAADIPYAASQTIYAGCAAGRGEVEIWGWSSAGNTIVNIYHGSADVKPNNLQFSTITFTSTPQSWRIITGNRPLVFGFTAPAAAGTLYLRVVRRPLGR